MAMNLSLRRADTFERRYHLPHHVSEKWEVGRNAYRARGNRQAHPDAFNAFGGDAAHMGPARQRDEISEFDLRTNYIIC